MMTNEETKYLKSISDSLKSIEKSINKIAANNDEPDSIPPRKSYAEKYFSKSAEEE